ncbi:hypothetical protein IWQ61_002231, partial [Dispira simplex]
NTTYVDKDNHPLPLPRFNLICEITLAVFIFVESLSRHVILPWNIRSSNAMGLILTTVPPCFASILSLWDAPIHESYMSGGPFVFFYPIRFVRLYFSTMEATTPNQNKPGKFFTTLRQVILPVMAIICTIMCISAYVHIFLHYFSDTLMDEKEFDFFGALFFTITCVTIGPNENVIPDNTVTRIWTMVTIFTTALLLPKAVSDFMDIWEEKSPFLAQGEAGPLQDHIIITGHLDPISVGVILKELFCMDHGYRVTNTSVALLSEDMDTEGFKVLLDDVLYRKRVVAVKGSANVFQDLHRVHANSAKAIFVLSDKFDDVSLVQRDAEIILMTTNIYNYVQMRNPEQLPFIYTQVSLVRSNRHFANFAHTKLITQCTNMLRMGLLAHSCTVRGLSTFLYLLTLSITDEAVEKVLGSIEDKVVDSMFDWFSLYLQGATQEVYRIRFHKVHHGQSFEAVAADVYERSGAVLLALGVTPARMEGVKDLNIHRQHRYICLAPMNSRIHKDDVGYIIANDLHTVHIIEQNLPIDPDEIDKGGGIGARWPDVGRTFLPSLDYGATGNPNEDPNEQSPLLEESVNGAPVSRKTTNSSQSSRTPLSPGLEALEGLPISDLSMLDPTLAVSDYVDRFFDDPKAHDPTPALSFSNHIIITDIGTEFPQDIECLVHCLDIAYKNSGLDRPDIVVLSASQPTSFQAKFLEWHRVETAQGSPLSPWDLQSVNIGKAKLAIVLRRTIDDFEDQAPEMVDALSHLAKRNIRLLGNNQIRTLVEVDYGPNSQLRPNEYLPNIDDDDILNITSEAFISGSTIPSAIMDLMLCNNMFNPQHLYLFKALIYSYAPSMIGHCANTPLPPPGIPISRRTSSPSPHSSRLVNSALTTPYPRGSPTCTSTPNPSELMLPNLSHGISDVPSGPSVSAGPSVPDHDTVVVHHNNIGCLPGHIQLVPIPYLTHNYGMLYSHLLSSHGAILMGLYRQVDEQRENYRCVIINPPKATSLWPTDQLYLISNVSYVKRMQGFPGYPKDAFSSSCHLCPRPRRRVSQPTNWP